MEGILFLVLFTRCALPVDLPSQPEGNIILPIRNLYLDFHNGGVLVEGIVVIVELLGLGCKSLSMLTVAMVCWAAVIFHQGGATLAHVSS